MNCDSLWTNVHLATCVPGAADGYGIVRDAALAIAGERIVFAGPRSELPAKLTAGATHDGHGHWLTPGLIDCHTHLVYAGDRAAEFEARLGGASYADIAHAGGGIAATVAATRAASRAELLAGAARRARALAAEGVTLVEVKSGYGLDEASELKMLEVARRLPDEAPLRVSTTLLAAHALPAEFTGRSDDYIEWVCAVMIPAAAKAGLADAVDAFCETIAFSAEQTTAVFRAARRAGLPVKLHADQLSDGGGAALAARHGAWSADHLEYTSARGVAALAASGSVAVLLPGAFYFLREQRLPPVEKLRRAGVPMAVATDCNPGSSPCTSLLLMLNMAATLFRLTPAETLAGVTCHAARALGLGSDCGQLAPGYRADAVMWDIGHPRELTYAFGANPRVGTLFAGRPVPADDRAALSVGFLAQ